MSKVYEGSLNLVVVARKEQLVVTLEKAANGRFTAQDAPDVWSKAVEAAGTHKAVLDRWAFYCPEICDKLGKDAVGFTAQAVARLPKADRVATLGVGKWGKPRLRFDAPAAKPAGKATTKIIID